jgi:tetratricopeptide (TPR) repeat protein
VKLFISYSRRDAGDFARHAHKYLVNAGHDAFIDVNSIKIGEPWANSIDNNISDCDIFVVILTPDSLTSKHVEQEVLQAQKQNKIIVPCIHEDVEYSEIKWGLEKLQGIEFSDEFKLTRKLYSKIKNYILHEKGFSLYQQGKYHEATEYFDKVLKIEPNNEFVRYNRFLILQHISLIGKGNTLYDQGKYQEAIECYNETIKLDPNNKLLWLNKGNILYQNLKRYEEAITCYDKVLQLDPDDIDSKKNRESALYTLEKERFTNLIDEADLCYKNKNYTRVIEICDQAIDIDEDNYISYLYKANALLQLSRYEEAIACYDKVLAIDVLTIDANNREAIKNKKIAEENLKEQQELYLCDFALACSIDDSSAYFTYHKDTIIIVQSKSSALSNQSDFYYIEPYIELIISNQSLHFVIAKIENSMVSAKLDDIDVIVHRNAKNYQVSINNLLFASDNSGLVLE